MPNSPAYPFHVCIPRHRCRRRGLRMPESLAERAMADRRCRRSRRAPYHMACDQRAGPSRRVHPDLAFATGQVALLVIYLTSTIVRTLLREFTMTWFEIAQCAAAFLISVGSS